MGSGIVVRLQPRGEYARPQASHSVLVNLPGLAVCFGQNALTDDQVDVPHGEYS